MNNEESIILYGGSFDPPHIGHMVVAQWVAEALSGIVRFLPAGNPPHKNNVGSGAHRLKMLEIATAGNPNFLVDDYEYNLGRVNYTVDTLERYSREYNVSREKLFFVIGSDSLRDFDTWRDPQGIANQATLLAFAREGVNWKELLLPLKHLAAKIVICKAPIIQVSSTLIRDRVRHGLRVDFLVPSGVDKYIAQMGLYKEGI